ncbi:hypothetical protein VOLCADRAFT_107701 [Volvox carteri f. nagariensis]|uniref:Methyltransferase FkbM domain-containing protein n=1 Tax=Volvox carteri f. nagariensis TaxID=3068 RepID=D8UFQ8_VOLCA|nr:uncharacterized protein VOLCADRAFT_107701 [Volvox carteri f. nagariensis]EFJ41421.1 hypothetical protein VOLCADRAFT_107701 [Volvox carteri f. nagariensis]|eukprot:XP_002957527.1 hypothetical protein VOLCADRAFT_107701 [Volvox carteri f. nagariensis]
MMGTFLKKYGMTASLPMYLLFSLLISLYAYSVFIQPRKAAAALSTTPLPGQELIAELGNYVRNLHANITDDPYNYVGLGEVRRLSNAQQGVHMSGYFDKSPWSGDGSKMLFQRVTTYDSEMSELNPLQIGFVDFGSPRGSRLEFLVNTTAWNHQQGTMLQWLGWSNSMIIYNDRVASNKFVGIVYDIMQRKQVATLPMPFYSINFNGTVAVSLNFGRLYVARRDYGYAVDSATQVEQRHNTCPDNDGVWLMEGIQDPANVKPRLLVSIRQVFDIVARLDLVDPFTQQKYASSFTGLDTNAIQTECIHWINHAQLNREGTKVMFLYRVAHCKYIRGFKTFVFTVDIATGELWRVPLAYGSHHDFGWDDNLISCDSSGYYYAKFKKFAVRLGRPVEVSRGGDGHCTFAPTSTHFILSDTYPRQAVPGFTGPIRTLFTWDLACTRSQMNLPSANQWSRDGRYVCFDSTHEGLGRQVYIAKVYDKALVRPGVDVVARPPRKFFMDLGARTGDSIEKMLIKAETDYSDYVIHAFECNPENMPLVRSGLDRLTTQYKLHPENVVLVEAAAWIEKGTLSFHMDSRNVGADGKPGKTGGSVFDSPHALGDLVTVPSVDFSDYLESAVTYVDHVVCKIDIEGAEYELLSHMIRRGSIILCDVVMIEWHSRFRKEWRGWDAELESMMRQLHIHVVTIG